MQKFRKSFRNSFKIGKTKSQGFDLASSPDVGQPNLWSEGNQWQADEVAVRTGVCYFQVKYLGCQEVTKSRGTEACEAVFKTLKSSKQKHVKAVLYISGDGFRLVDEKTRGLILDQVVEKVSFCSPIKDFERGFTYICRDSSSQRWLCHAFSAANEVGERLCNAVGFAFTVCLERKQKQENECLIAIDSESKNFAAKSPAARNATLTEKLIDPQIVKPNSPPPLILEDQNLYAIARPKASDFMKQRQTSFKGFGKLQSETSAFKRQYSLNPGVLPSTLERSRKGIKTNPRQNINFGLELDSFDKPWNKTTESNLANGNVTQTPSKLECSKETIVKSPLSSFRNGIPKLSLTPDYQRLPSSSPGLQHKLKVANSPTDLLLPSPLIPFVPSDFLPAQECFTFGPREPDVLFYSPTTCTLPANCITPQIKGGNPLVTFSQKQNTVLEEGEPKATSKNPFYNKSGSNPWDLVPDQTTLRTIVEIASDVPNQRDDDLGENNNAIVKSQEIDSHRGSETGDTNQEIDQMTNQSQVSIAPPKEVSSFQDETKPPKPPRPNRPTIAITTLDNKKSFPPQIIEECSSNTRRNPFGSDLGSSDETTTPDQKNPFYGDGYESSD